MFELSRSTFGFLSLHWKISLCWDSTSKLKSFRRNKDILLSNNPDSGPFNIGKASVWEITTLEALKLSMKSPVPGEPVYSKSTTAIRFEISFLSTAFIT